MNRNYEIINGIYLVHGGYRLELHNRFDFQGLQYSIGKRSLVLGWRRSVGDWVSVDTPEGLEIEFGEVAEFRFMPRNASMPFTEDDCVDAFGYWVDEDWANGIILVEPNQEVDPQWLAAISFMSGAIIAVQAERSSAKVIV